MTTIVRRSKSWIGYLAAVVLLGGAVGVYATQAGASGPDVTVYASPT